MADEASTEKTKNLSENEEKSTFSDSKEYETTEKERIGDVDDKTGTTENYKTKTEEKMAEDEIDMSSRTQICVKQKSAFEEKLLVIL